MRTRVHNQILYLHAEDVPTYKKKGSIVRNSYFWALRSIADRANFNQEWEFADIVWPALSRMLMSFAASGYLGLQETTLAFEYDTPIPESLQAVSTRYDPADLEEDTEADWEGSEDL